MAKRKRATRQTGIVERAVSAGRRAFLEAEKRVPPDLRRQVERQLKDADKMARAAIKQLQAQARKASTRADVNSVLKRIDGLTRQAREIAFGRGSRTTSTPSRRTAAATPRKPAATTKRKPATTRKAAAPRQATASRSTAKPRAAAARRRRAATPNQEVVAAPMAEMGAVEIIEITPEP